MTEGQLFVFAGIAALIIGALLEHAWVRYRDRRRP